MKIVSRKDGQDELYRALEEMTWQAPFKKWVECDRCKSQMYPLMVIDDENELCRAERPANVKIYPHDTTSIALYMCPECGQMYADWNQA